MVNLYKDQTKETTMRRLVIQKYNYELEIRKVRKQQKEINEAVHKKNPRYSFKRVGSHNT